MVTELINLGMTIPEIADEVGVKAHTTVRRWQDEEVAPQGRFAEQLAGLLYQRRLAARGPVLAKFKAAYAMLSVTAKPAFHVYVARGEQSSDPNIRAEIDRALRKAGL